MRGGEGRGRAFASFRARPLGSDFPGPSAARRKRWRWCSGPFIIRLLLRPSLLLALAVWVVPLWGAAASPSNWTKVKHSKALATTKVSARARPSAARRAVTAGAGPRSKAQAKSDGTAVNGQVAA